LKIQAVGGPAQDGKTSPKEPRTNAAGAAPDRRQKSREMTMTERPSALLTDLYQINMMQAYLDHGETAMAVFEFFVRNLPPRRGFLVAAGLEQALDFLEHLRFPEAEINWLRSTGRFRDNLIDYLADFRFSGDVHAMPEGTVFFANQPILRVTAPLPQAQFVESRLINILHFQTLIASKAARTILAAPNKVLVDFGMRRAHGAEAGLMAARASYITGYAGTATVLAGEQFGIPLYGTMAHSFIESFDDEMAAFAAFAKSRPDNLVLLLDTYDTEAAARKVVALAPRLREAGIAVRGVRLDSGDLVALSKSVRAILDAGGLRDVTIFASGGLDEDQLAVFTAQNAPIDGLGVGTSLTTSSDVPALDCVYKLQEYAGVARRKRSAKKITWPGRKQVWRSYGADDRMAGDILGLDGETQSGAPLVEPVMQGGRRLQPAPSLEDIRRLARHELERLPERLGRLEAGATYPVTVSDALNGLGAEVDRRIAQMPA
jgi:nicotinate phosphoribosyltransferase